MTKRYSVPESIKLKTHLEKNTVTVRDRDTMEQETISIDDLSKKYCDSIL